MNLDSKPGSSLPPSIYRGVNFDFKLLLPLRQMEGFAVYVNVYKAPITM